MKRLTIKTPFGMWRMVGKSLGNGGVVHTTPTASNNVGQAGVHTVVNDILDIVRDCTPEQAVRVFRIMMNLDYPAMAGSMLGKKVQAYGSIRTVIDVTLVVMDDGKVAFDVILGDPKILHEEAHITVPYEKIPYFIDRMIKE